MKVLYITYDGLLDPLGSSQILPYLIGINDSSKSIFIISVEKPERYSKDFEKLNRELLDKNIYWEPLLFSQRFGVFGKIWDFLKMYLTASKLSFSKKINIVHARGHISAQVASFLKQIFKVRYIFDFRGLWVDERVDKGGWNLEKSFDKLQYKYFKFKEIKLLNNADHIVLLTNKVRDEICRISETKQDKLTVIPCCADFNHFTLQTPSKKLSSREILGIPNNSLVFGFLGSVGPMYLIDDYFKFIELIYKKYALIDIDVFGLLITNDLDAANFAKRRIVNEDLNKNIIVLSTGRDQVPALLHSLDVLISFISSTYARQASSPTKIAESFACGIPIISNQGVGDVEDQINNINGGKIIPNTLQETLENILPSLDEIVALDRKSIRNKAREFLSLDIALQRYKDVYSKIHSI